VPGSVPGRFSGECLINGGPATALAMVFKLVESVQNRWCAIRGVHLVALVRAGATFESGVLVECEGASAA
jgi:putative transposase